jgi:hypothetical protein
MASSTVITVPKCASYYQTSRLHAFIKIANLTEKRDEISNRFACLQFNRQTILACSNTVLILNDQQVLAEGSQGIRIFPV